MRMCIEKIWKKKLNLGIHFNFAKSSLIESIDFIADCLASDMLAI